MKKISLLKYLDKKVQKSGGVMTTNDELLQSMVMREDPYFSGKHILEVKKELAFLALCAESEQTSLDSESKQILD
jgi:hypothetical protein